MSRRATWRLMPSPPAFEETKSSPLRVPECVDFLGPLIVTLAANDETRLFARLRSANISPERSQFLWVEQTTLPFRSRLAQAAL